MRKLATKNICFTFWTTNIVKYIEKGGDGKRRKGILSKYLPEIPGWFLEINDKNLKEAKFRKIKKGEKYPISWFNKILRSFFGIYFYGIYPFYRVKTLTIVKEKENLKGTGPENWITSTGREEVEGLMFSFPRPFVFTKVELMDGLCVDVKLVLKLIIIMPYIPAYELGTDFFLQVASVLQSEVIDKLNTIATIKDFIKAKKGETEGFLKSYREEKPDGTPSDVNQALIRQTGVMIDGISINDWRPGDEKTEKLMKMLTEAEITGDSKIAEATKNKEVTKLNAEATRDKTNIEAEAEVKKAGQFADIEGKRIKNLMENLNVENGDSNKILETVGKISQAHSIRDSKLTTWVQNATPVISVGVEGGEKK